MGSVRLASSSAPTWWTAAISLACALVTTIVVVTSSEHAGPVVLVWPALVALAAGLVGGWPALVTASACFQVGAVAWLVTLDDRPPSAAVILVALIVWLSFEAGMASLEVRADTTLTTAALWARVTDLVGLAAVGGVVGIVALAVSASGPDGETLLLRGLGLAIGVGVVAGLLVLSRRPRRS